MDEQKAIENYEKYKEKNPGATIDDYEKYLAQYQITLHKDFVEKMRQREFEENKKELTDPQKIADNYKEINETINPLIEADKERESANRDIYKKEAREDVTTDLPGLTEQQRRSMQQNANAAINKQVQNYKRSIASGSGKRGIRGGAAMAPQLELSRQAMDVQNQFQRDLTEKDTDLAMRRLAAYLSGVEGRSTQDLIKRGQYFDYITGRQQQGKEAATNQYFQSLFRKVK